MNGVPFCWLFVCIWRGFLVYLEIGGASGGVFNDCGRFGCGAGGGIRTHEGLRHRLLKLEQQESATAP